MNTSTFIIQYKKGQQCYYVLFWGDGTIFSEYKLCDLSQFSSINIGNLQGDNIRWNISDITTFLNIWIKMRYFSCCGYKCKHRGNGWRKNFTRSFPTTRCLHLPTASLGSKAYPHNPPLQLLELPVSAGWVGLHSIFFFNSQRVFHR